MMLLVGMLLLPNKNFGKSSKLIGGTRKSGLALFRSISQLLLVIKVSKSIIHVGWRGAREGAAKRASCECQMAINFPSTPGLVLFVQKTLFMTWNIPACMKFMRLRLGLFMIVESTLRSLCVRMSPSWHYNYRFCNLTGDPSTSLFKFFSHNFHFGWTVHVVTIKVKKSSGEEEKRRGGVGQRSRVVPSTSIKFPLSTEIAIWHNDDVFCYSPFLRLNTTARLVGTW